MVIYWADLFADWELLVSGGDEAVYVCDYVGAAWAAEYAGDLVGESDVPGSVAVVCGYCGGVDV